jgi:sugar phosphate isomerase/epimerase
MSQLDFVVKVLTGTPEELGKTAVSWGYDGIEFMPDPELFNNMLKPAEAVHTSLFNTNEEVMAMVEKIGSPKIGGLPEKAFQ